MEWTLSNAKIYDIFQAILRPLPSLPTKLCILGDNCLIFFFLSDPSPITDHWLPLSLTDWLADWLINCSLVDLIDVTLACEDDNSKLVEVVTIAEVQSWSRLCFLVWSGLVKIFKFRFCLNADVWLSVWS